MRDTLTILILAFGVVPVGRAADRPATQPTSDDATADVLLIDAAEIGIDPGQFAPLRVQAASLPTFAPDEPTQAALRTLARHHQPRVLLLSVSPELLHAFGDTQDDKANALDALVGARTNEPKTNPADSPSPAMQTVLLLDAPPESPAGKYAARVLDAAAEPSNVSWLWAGEADSRTTVLAAYRRAGGERRLPERIAPPLQDGETLVFLGDSITKQHIPAGGFVGGVERALSTTERSIVVKRAVIDGARAETFSPEVLQRQALRFEPDVTVVYLGTAEAMAIAQPGTPKASPEEFGANLRRIVGALQRAGSRVVLVTPAVIGENVLPSREIDQELDVFAETVREVAFLQQCPVADARGLFWTYLREHNIDREVKGVLTRDGVHLNAAGQEKLAEAITRALAPSSTNSAPE